MSQSERSAWTGLYKLGGAAALLMVLLFMVKIVVYIVWPPPRTATAYFNVFRSNKLLGLLDFDLLLVVDQALQVPICLALYIALRRVNESIMAVATALSLVSIAAFIAARPALEMLHLGGQYAAAATDAERAGLVGAGQAMLAIFNGTAFHTSYVLGSVAMVMVASVMLRGDVFSRAAAYVGIATGVIGFGLYVPGIGIVLAILSALGLQIWNILIARRFFQLAVPDRSQ